MTTSSVCNVFQTDCNIIYVELMHDSNVDEIKKIQNSTIQINKTKIYNVLAEPLDAIEFAKYSGYCIDDNKIIFAFPSKLQNQLMYGDNIFVACENSGWGNARLNKAWKLNYEIINSKPVLALKFPINNFDNDFEFKFISESGVWIEPTFNMPNVICHDNISNLKCFLNKTGKHFIKLILDNPVSLTDDSKLILETGEEFAIDNKPYLYSISSDKELGAIIFDNTTTFRLFAPRSKYVRVAYYKSLDGEKSFAEMFYDNDGTWSVEIPKNLNKYYYYFQLKKHHDDDIENSPKILDPYSKASVSREGPGIIINDKKSLKSLDFFKPPHIKDAVIVETHLRDCLANAKIKLDKTSRLGFSGLRKWLTKRSCYFSELGANFVELMPVQEFDAKSKDEYHWGYMPVNYFSPCSCYAKNPEKASQIKEFKKLVRAFHRKNKAVILDVVYNHVGEPNHLRNIDEDYYFRHNKNGELENFSGCGNDLRTESHMVQRLIYDSTKYLVETFNIDGFRFDLAELVGKDFINFLQNNLQKIKPSLTFILEPWSFRGYIGNSMQNSECSCWNDNYREFMTQYIRGHGNSNGLKYFLSGSLGYKTKFPYQSVNYVSSHDDFGWMDKITENAHFDGSTPTENDCRRTQLILACMMCSLGVPMIHQGMDFMQSKHGIHNTYNRGELNALDYSLIKKYKNSHRYFSRFIKLRLSKHFAMLRLYKNPGDDYFQFFHAKNSSAAGMLFNANNILGDRQLFFIINPDNKTVNICLEGLNLKNFKLYADENFVFRIPRKFNQQKITNDEMTLDPLSCRIFIS